VDAEKDNLVGKLFFYEESDLRMAMNGYKWSLAMRDIQQWLRNKVKYESGLEDKTGEELENYIDAYCTVREEIYEIMSSYGLNDED
jgi:hypothetical protein